MGHNVGGGGPGGGPGTRAGQGVDDVEDGGHKPFSEGDQQAIEVFNRDYKMASLSGGDTAPVPGLDSFIDSLTVSGDRGEVKEKVAALAEMPEISEVVITLPGRGALSNYRGDYEELCGGGSWRVRCRGCRWAD